MIYCHKRELNMIWSKKYGKTNYISAINTSFRELVTNIDSVKRDQPPLRFSLVNPFKSFKKAYEEYYKNLYKDKWNGSILDTNYLKDLHFSIQRLF